MNIEVERKYQIEDLNALRDRCQAAGAKEASTKRDIDTYFKVPQKVVSTKYLRLRCREGVERGTLAYHEVVDDLTTNEWEIEVDDLKVAEEILIKLGFPVEVVVDKRRETFHLANCEIVLDEVQDLGLYMEIEAPNEQELNSMAEQLGLNGSSVIAGVGYPDLLKQKNASRS